MERGWPKLGRGKNDPVLEPEIDFSNIFLLSLLLSFLPYREGRRCPAIGLYITLVSI
jgi:hypothetical protein